MNINTMTRSTERLLLSGSMLFCLTMAPLAAHAADKKPWSISASVGAEYDSNITVSEVDVDTGSGDEAALFDFSASYKGDIDEKNSFRVGYSFSQSLHQDATNFDLQTHLATALVKHKFDGFDLGLDYLYINTSLGRSGFLQIHKASPYVSFFATPTLFVRANYAYTDKNLKTSNDRDAQTHSVGASAFYFMNQSKSYLMASYRYDNLDANANQFDYGAHDVKVRYQTKFPLGNRDARFRVGARYLRRDYDGVTPSIGVVRNDERISAETMLEIPFLDIWSLKLEYRYTDAKSNLASADYSENLLTSSIGFEF